MDNCANTSDCAYVTGITNLFTMPTDSGGVPAIAVETRWASLIISAYTIMVVLIFLMIWNLIVSVIAIFSPDDRNSSRYVSLVVIWNSNGPSSAALMMLKYLMRLPGRDLARDGGVPFGGNQESKSNNSGNITSDREIKGGQPSNEHPARSQETKSKACIRNLRWGYLFFVVSYTVWAGNISAGLFITRILSMGNFAPVNPSHVFYPNQSTFLGGASMEGLEKFSIWKYPSALRALGAVESSNLTVMERVHTKRLEPSVGQTTSLWAGLSYSYNLTGVDMGLQSDPKLRLVVEGACHTDYTWLVSSTDEEDTYRIWGGNDTFEVKHKEESNLPPMLAFFIDIERVNEQPFNTSYALIINTAGHYSRTRSQDPWYATESFQTNKTNLELYQILPKRPVLSCWETKRWHLNGKEVESTRLDELPGLNLHRFWMEDVFPHEFAVPRVANLAKVAGQSALKSASFGSSLYNLYSFYVLDSGSSGLLNDLERLVRASWISGANVLRDTTTYDPRDIGNSARRPDGSVEPGIGEFVLESRDVGTLSVRFLFSVPITLVILLIAWLSLAALIKNKGLVTLPSIQELIVKDTEPRPAYKTTMER
ncbi:hypothetical protein HOY82DRAFT_480522 [Tuber indicum]|nr:hypothetical protein HOY82DRAFT_480522 [Tuber indicum]